MNKKTFLKDLEEHLIGVSKVDKQEILADYNEHFVQGKADKRKEAEICKSLGDPKVIAREARRELAATQTDIKSEMIEAWVATKRLAIDLFTQARKTVDDTLKTKNGNTSLVIVSILAIVLFIAILNGPLVIIAAIAIAIYLTYNHYKGKHTTHRKTRLILSILFNALFFVWFWLSLLVTILVITIASFALTIAGFVVAGIALVYLVSYATPLIAPVLWSALFAGTGVALIGILASWLAKTLVKVYIALTKKYIALNKELIA